MLHGAVEGRRAFLHGENINHLTAGIDGDPHLDDGVDLVRIRREHSVDEAAILKPFNIIGSRLLLILARPRRARRLAGLAAGGAAQRLGLLWFDLGLGLRFDDLGLLDRKSVV